MKKSVIMLIVLIYAAAVFLVGFLGRNPKVFEAVIPVERVEITNEADDENSRWGKYVVIEPDAKGRMQYQINYQVYPENATTSSITFTIEAAPADCATIDEKTGLVTFTKSGIVKVFVVAADGSTSQDTFTVVGDDPNQIPSN
jgi:hypothetical protein